MGWGQRQRWRLDAPETELKRPTMRKCDKRALHKTKLALHNILRNRRQAGAPWWSAPSAHWSRAATRTNTDLASPTPMVTEAQKRNTKAQGHKDTDAPKHTDKPTQSHSQKRPSHRNNQTSKHTNKQANTRHRQSQRQTVGQHTVCHLWGGPPQGPLQCKQQADEQATRHSGAATTTKGHNTTRRQNHTGKEPQQQNNGTDTQGHKGAETQRPRTTTGQRHRDTE